MMFEGYNEDLDNLVLGQAERRCRGLLKDAIPSLPLLLSSLRSHTVINRISLGGVTEYPAGLDTGGYLVVDVIMEEEPSQLSGCKACIAIITSTTK